MVLPKELGVHLIQLRNEVGLSQKDLAKKASIYPGVLSRIETGERSATDSEMQSIIAALNSPSAHSLGQVLAKTWTHLDRPPLAHPDEGLLWESELCLVKIANLRRELSLELNGSGPFHARLNLVEEEIKHSAALVWNLEHTIAFAGDIGVGKTSALCALLGLRVSRRPGSREVEVLEVGPGRTTVCEVQLVQGLGYGLVVECLTDVEVRQEVFEFSDSLLRNVDNAERGDLEGGESTGDQIAFGTTREIARCIRNMSRLTVPRAEAGGGTVRIDPTVEMAQSMQDANALAGEIVSRMNLQARQRREIWYSPESGRQPLVWLEDIFRQVNNGRHSEFSIPRVITVMLPENILGEETLKLRLVDTKGIDGMVERADLETHLIDPNAVVVLCTRFNDAPAVSVQAILEQAKTDGLDGLDTKTSVLVLVHSGEALEVKYDDGTEVDTVEEGYSLKEDEIWKQLGGTGFECAAVEFFDCKDEFPQRVQGALINLVWGLREQRHRKLVNVIGYASVMVDNYQEEQVVTEQREAARLLKVWLDDNRQLDKFLIGFRGRLAEAIRKAHPSTLRASVRREGEWDNLKYSYLLGVGVRSMVDAVVSKRVAGFEEVARTAIHGLPNAEDLVNQAVRIMKDRRQDLRNASNGYGQTIHTYEMKNDKGLWESSNAEWGKGPGYRERVWGHHQDWFTSKSSGDEGLQNQVQEFVQREWEKLLGQVEDILE